MASTKITKSLVDQLTSGAKAAFAWDNQLKGFGVKVTPAGSKVYVFQYRMGGRGAATRRYTIGQHGSPWTPHTARAEAERLALMVATGSDPAALAKDKQLLSVDLAFSAYAQRFLETCSGPGWKGLVERTVRLHLAPKLGSKPLPEITRSQISSLLDGLPQDQLALRRNTFAVIRRIFRWAIARGDITRSPCEGMETPRAVTPRERVLSDEELKAVWKALPSQNAAFANIIRLLILTGQRKEEVTALDWSELDQIGRAWTLPSARAKNSVTHIVPLSDAVFDIVAGLHPTPMWPKRGLVVRNGAGKRFTGHSAAKRTLDRAISAAGYDILPWRLHDLRRTAATNLQRLGIRFEVTEAILNHQSGSRAGVAAVYQRHNWASEKREALQLWGRHFLALVAD